jgi:RNA polymerase sigma-70 factor (ECF subfamily)
MTLMHAIAPAAALASDDDLALVRRIAAGDRSAFVLLMRRHNRRLYRLARAVLRDNAEAEEALQDAYLSAYRSIGGFRGESALSTWLSRLVLNECFGRLRRQMRRQNLIPMVHAMFHIGFEPTVNTTAEEPDQALGRAQMRALLERKLDELPEGFRTVFVLRSVEEMTVEETAQCLGIPENTVRTRHFRAKSLLREALAQELDFAERNIFEFGGRDCDRVVDTVLARLTR